MRKYLYIGMGGFLGAVLRFALARVQIFDYHGNIPLNTLFINISGCLLLAFLLASASSFLEMDPEIKVGVSTGLLGAYTTFSTLCKELARLMENGLYTDFLLYITLTVLLGFAAAYSGFAAARVLQAFLERLRTGSYGIENNTDREAL